MPEDQPNAGNLWLGIFIGGGLDVIGAIVSVPVSVKIPGMLFYLGLAQVLWILPTYGALSTYGYKETAKGVLIAAGICFLLNAACWGLLFGVGGRIGG